MHEGNHAATLPDMAQGEMNRSTARSIIYHTLSRCYGYPDEMVCSWAAEKAWIKPLEEAIGLLNEDSFDEIIQCFKEFFSEKGTEPFLEMMREYTRLFIDNFPRVVCPPYSSAYMEGDKMFIEKNMSAVLRFYQSNGFALPEEIKGAPDHIALELEFMGIMAERAAAVTGNKKISQEELQLDFFSRFILSWVPVFCGRIAEHARLPLYRCLSAFTRDFIYFEKNYLGVPEEG